MPEGDTIFRTACTLRKVLAGVVVTSFESSAPALRTIDMAGKRITAVQPHGKNLLIRFDDGRSLLTHLRMHGAWHIYRHGEKWWRPRWQSKVVIETQDWIAVCFNAPVVELLLAKEAGSASRLRKLGPDLLDPTFDKQEALKRLRERNALTVGEALMDQRALAGIGNVYKSETLFLCAVDPFALVSTLDNATLESLISKARKLMHQNLQGFPRTT